MQWIRNNAVLVAGIVLPVLLVAGFFLLQSGTRHLSTPPTHDFLVVAHHYDAHQPLDYVVDFEVRDQRVVARATPAKRDDRYPVRRRATLYRYDRDNQRFTEIAWERPATFDALEDTLIVPIPELAALNVDKGRQGPDGYVFEHASRGNHGGLLGALFGMDHGRGPAFLLNRPGGNYPLPPLPVTANSYGHDVRFVGWIVEPEASS